jgi:prepilin-type N-terminal cleavage/methylation domain-containing protein
MKKGYTLIELIVVIIIIGIVAAMTVPIMLKVVDAWSFSSSFQTNSVMSSIVAMHRMSDEIRRIKDNLSVIAASPGTSTLSFTLSHNNVDTIITYRLNGSTIERGVGSPAVYDGLLDNVQSLSFQYYDDINAAPLASVNVNPLKTNIRLVEVNITVLAGSNNLSFKFKIKPRNIRKV